MAEIAITDYIQMLENSHLFKSSEQVAELFERWKTEDTEHYPENVVAFSDWLVGHDYLTRWQADNILAGKYKGFFLGSYKLLRSIGVGGMSSVYLAYHDLLDRQVAIKVLPKSRISSDTSYLERFLQEARAVAQLDHPNIVRAYDIDNENNTVYYFVMEFVDGTDLFSLVRNNGPLDIFKAAQYIRQAAIGLGYAHQMGLIHRDVKPANLMITKDETIKVMDLGLARFTDETQASLTLAHDENVLGTADYLAPEQARNSHQVDGRADIYGLGCTLYYVLVGHVPFPDGTLAQRIVAHQKRMPKAIQEDRPEVPQELCEICWKMMAKDPNERQQSMQEVADDLTDFLLEHDQKIDGYTGGLHRNRKRASESSQEAVSRELAEMLQDANKPKPKKAQSARNHESDAFLAFTENVGGGRPSSKSAIQLDIHSDHSTGSSSSGNNGGSSSGGKKSSSGYGTRRKTKKSGGFFEMLASLFAPKKRRKRSGYRK